MFFLLRLPLLLPLLIRLGASSFAFSDYDEDRRFRFCPISPRWRDGGDSVRISDVHGARSHHVSAIRRQSRSLEYRNYHVSVLDRKGALSSHFPSGGQPIPMVYVRLLQPSVFTNLPQLIPMYVNWSPFFARHWNIFTRRTIIWLRRFLLLLLTSWEISSFASWSEMRKTEFRLNSFLFIPILGKRPQIRSRFVKLYHLEYAWLVSMKM